MCFFVCLSLPKKDSLHLRALSEGFELIDATGWSIGEATSGNADRDVAFLITDGGCSCFISNTKAHGAQSAKLKEFETLIRSLSEQLPIVSILIHHASGDLQHERVIRKAKRIVSVDEILGQIDRLDPDVRYIIRGDLIRTDAASANTFSD
jgi:hypothetical protein